MGKQFEVMTVFGIYNTERFIKILHALTNMFYCMKFINTDWECVEI